MQKIYLLLRNNQQSGPHSLEELQALELKPADLVWTEGKIGWKSPGEIPALAPKEDTPSQPASLPPGGSNENISKQSKIFILLPGRTVTATPLQEDTSEADPATVLEKKAEALYQKIQAYQEQQSAAPKEELETKYTRSLEDIRNEYAGWLHEKKNRKALPWKKPLLVAASVSALILAGIFLYNLPVSNPGLVSKETMIPKDELTPPMIHTAKPVTNKKIQSAANKTKKITSKNVRKKPVTKTEPVTVRRKETTASNTSLPSLVVVSGRYKPVGRGVSASDITLQNGSDEYLKVVAVDVIYYRPDGKVIDKKTIYFRNIAPNASLTMQAPAHNKAEEVKYKTGLISASESGLYYAMN